LRLTLPRGTVALLAIGALVGGLDLLRPGGARIAIAGASHACTISGSIGDDVIRGTPGDDVICGLEGNDQIDGRLGNDVLDGGPGDDALAGGDGADTVTFESAPAGLTADLAGGSASGYGSDVLQEIEALTGSGWDDVLTGTPARDTLSGLGGTDLLFGVEGPDTLLGGDGEDYLSGSGGSVLDGGGSTNTCVPGPGTVTTISCLPPSPPDPNDSQGFLDVRRVDSVLESEAPVWRVQTGSRWSVFKMWDRGFILLHLDTFGADVSDYYAMIRSTGGRLRATLYRNGHALSRLTVWRDGRRSVFIRIPLRKLLTGGTRRFYKWRLLTLTDRCRRACLDRVPGDGALVQPLP
jgi:hypothetical protein